MKVIKHPLIIFLSWLAPPLVNAEPELGVAFKGGPNGATHDEEYRVNRYGFSGGLAGHLSWNLAGRFSVAVQSELLYVPRGSEVIFEGEYAGRSRQHYLDITVAVRPEVRLDPVGVYLLLGGGLDVLLSANKENASGAKQDITDGLRRIDVALIAGAGIALHLPRRDLGPLRLGTVFLEGRHDHGLVDTDPVSGGFQNRNTSLMLGLSFALGSGTVNPQPSASPVRSDPTSPASAAVSAE